MSKPVLRFIAPLAVVLTIVLIGCDRTAPDALVARADQALTNQDYRAALLDLKAVLQEDPRHARARWLLAEVYLELGDGQSAEKELRRAQDFGVGVEAVLPALGRALVIQRDYQRLAELEIDPALAPQAKAEIMAWRALALIETDDLEGAQAAIDVATEAQPDAVDVRYVRARLLFEQEEHETSQQLAERVVKQFPDYAAAWSLLGEVHLVLQDSAKAEEAFGFAVEHRQYGWEDRAKLALIRVSLDKKAEAEKDALFLQKNAPQFHMGHYLAGVLHYRAGRIDQAEEALERALELSPQHFHTIYALARLHTEIGNTNRARLLAEQANLVQPNYVPARELMAQWLIRENKGKEAERLVRPILQAQPDNAKAKDLLAASLLVQGRMSEAAELFNEISASGSDKFEAQLKAGTGLLLAGAAEDAQPVLRRAVDLEPDNVKANARLVASLVETEASQEGLRIAKALVERRPDDPDALNLLASAYLAAGEDQEATDVYRRTLSLDPGNQEASTRLAAEMVANGDGQQALEYSSAGLEKHPESLSLLLLHAEAARLLEDHDLRESTLLSAIDAHPEEPSPRALLSRKYLDENSPEKALRLLSNFPETEHTGFLAARSEVYYRLNQLNEAQRDLEALSRLLPPSVELAWQEVRMHQALGDKVKLEAALNRVLTLEPGASAAKLVKVRLAILDGRFEEARALLAEDDLKDFDRKELLLTRIALELGVGNADAEVESAQQLFDTEPSSRHLFMLTRASLRAGKPKQAIALLGQWLDEHPDDLQMLIELSDVYQGQGMTDHAVERLRQVDKLDPENLYALNNLAWFLRKYSPSEAQIFGRRAYQLAPDQPSIVDTYAVVLAETKDLDGALRVVDEGIQIVDQKDTLKLRRAMILSMRGELDLAVAQLQELVGSDTQKDVQKQAQDMLDSVKR